MCTFILSWIIVSAADMDGSCGRVWYLFWIVDWDSVSQLWMNAKLLWDKQMVAWLVTGQ